MGVGSYLVVIILDVVVAWGLCIFFQSTSQNLSLLTAWFRLLYSAIFAVALINYFTVFQLIENADYLTVFEPSEVEAQVMLSVNAFADGWNIAFIFLGLHLICLGNLVLRSATVPRILGVLLVLAGVGYLISEFSQFLLPDYDLSLLMMIGWGELIFAVWLLWKGSKDVKIAGTTILFFVLAAAICYNASPHFYYRVLKQTNDGLQVAAMEQVGINTSLVIEAVDRILAEWYKEVHSLLI